MARAELRLSTINDLFDYLVETLSHPSDYISATTFALRVDRLGTKLPIEAAESGFVLNLAEVRIASRRPRIGTLVRFPRNELLPKPDMLEQADLFLAR